MWRYSCCASSLRALAPLLPSASARALHSGVSVSARAGAVVAIGRSSPVHPSHASVSSNRTGAYGSTRHFSSAAAASTADGSSAAAAAAAATAASSSTAAAAASRPGGWLCSVADEAVIRISAAPSATSPGELLKYLHNLATLDIYELVGLQHSEGHAHFLSAKGRVQFEGMFAPIDAASAEWMAAGAVQGTHAMRGPAGLTRAGMLPAPSISPALAVKSTRPRGFYFILPAAAAPLALAHLRQYNLRRKAVIEDVTSLIDVHQVVPFRVLEQQQQYGRRAAEERADGGASQPKNEVARLLGLESPEQVEQLGLHAMIDPRCRSMGVRILAPKGQTPPLPASFSVVSDPSFYHAYRVLQGVCSSPVDIVADKSLPLEMSLIESGGVSFEKGCYLGQELTARTHFQGVVRKRVWPAFATRRGEQATMRGKPIQQLLVATATASSSASLSSPSSPSSIAADPSPSHPASAFPEGDPFKQLQFYFPFFDPSIPTIPADTPIMRSPVTAAAASLAAASEGVTPAPVVVPAKEVARVLSSHHNVFLAMLRSEHVEDASHTLQLQGCTGVGDALTVVPYQPAWWNRDAQLEDGAHNGQAGDSTAAGRT